MASKKILIVGGCGYVGGALVTKLSVSRLKFTIYDNLLYEDRYLRNVDFIYGDVRDTRKLKSIINDYDSIVWLAAIVGDGACAVNQELTISVNEDSIKWLCENYKKEGKIIFASTCSVYGANKNHNIDEESKTNPLSLYAGTKLNCEKYLMKRGNSVIFRLGTLHGIGDSYSRPRLDLVVNVLTMKAVYGEPITVFGGEQWRPVLNVSDVAEALYNSLLEKPEWESLEGIYNIAESNVCIKEVAQLIQELTPTPVEIKYQNMKFEDLRDYHVSTEKLFKATNWKPQKDLRTSILELVKVYSENRIKDPSLNVFHNEKFIKELMR